MLTTLRRIFLFAATMSAAAANLPAAERPI